MTYQSDYSSPSSMNEEKGLMMAAHLSAPVAFLLSAGWLSFLGPLVIWFFYKDKDRAVREASAGAFNFNVTMTLISWGLWLSVFLTLGVGFIWAIPGWIVLFIIQVVAHIKGAMTAYNGGVYNYPAQIRILD